MLTERFVEQTIQERLALQNWRIAVNKGLSEHIKDVRRLERRLKRKLESVGGIVVFNEYVDAKNEEMLAERPRMRPVEEWP